MRTIGFLALVAFVQPASADVWTSQDTGDDRNPGTQKKPKATIQAALDVVTPGETLHVLPGKQAWPGDIRIVVSGTKDKPIVADGHGSVISNRRQLPTSAWKNEGQGVFSRQLPNNAWGMQQHWEGGFPLVWFDKKPGKNVTKKADLQPFTFFLYKNRKQAKTDPLHNTLYIRLPEDRPLGDFLIESIAGESGIFVGGNHVIVRNFVTEYGGRDGFATHRNTGVIFDSVEARFFMDQGISHHGADVLVKNSHFHHNAGAGVVDVYPEVNARYENCLIEDNAWRGGVELHNGTFEFANCIIRRNPNSQIVVTKQAEATFTNCLIVGKIRDNRNISPGSSGVKVGDVSRLTLKNCTIIGCSTGLSATVTPDSFLAVERSIITDCGTNLAFTSRKLGNEKPFNINERLMLRGNLFDKAPFTVTTKTQTEIKGGWRVTQQIFEPLSFSTFAKTVGDRGSEVRDFVEKNPLANQQNQKNPAGEFIGYSNLAKDQRVRE